MIQKVLIYATSARGLLVFDEPDFPDVPIQVPGGTVDAAETLPEAARREFTEETGISSLSEFRWLGEVEHVFEKGGSSHTIYRAYFHLELEGDYPDGWHHYETSPSGGGAPILFRFFWLDFVSASSRLGPRDGGVSAFASRPPISGCRKLDRRKCQLTGSCS